MSTRIKIAICYDFDGTLIRGNIQEHSLYPLPQDRKKKDFWKEVKRHAESHDMDEVLAYMHLMLREAKKKDRKLNKNSLSEHGKNLTFFPGVNEWFKEINSYRSSEIMVEHYIISSGIDEMIKGSLEVIKSGRLRVFASGFVYDANEVPEFPARSVNYTTKAQYLFRINKGIRNSWDNAVINEFMSEEKRRIPFSQMIYIGDGDTDVPAMKMINHKGGYSIAVYPPKKGKQRNETEKEKLGTVKGLKKNNRCQFVAEADYTKDKELHRIVTSLIDRIIE